MERRLSRRESIDILAVHAKEILGISHYPATRTLPATLAIIALDDRIVQAIVDNCPHIILLLSKTMTRPWPLVVKMSREVSVSGGFNLA